MSWSKNLKQLFLDPKVKVGHFLYRMENLAKYVGYLFFSKYGVEPEKLDGLEEFILNSNIIPRDSFKYNSTEKFDEKNVTYDRNSCFWKSFSHDGDFLVCRGQKKKVQSFLMPLARRNAYYNIKVDLSDKSKLPLNYHKLNSNKIWVTNYDIKAFQLWGTNIELVQDSEYNAYVYKESPVKFNKIFTKKIMDQIYEIKKSGKYKLIIKPFMTYFHGVLFKNKKREFNDKIRRNDQIDGDIYVPNAAGDEILIKKDKTFDNKILYNHNRNSTFFYAHIRNNLMLNDCKKVMDEGLKVLRVYTDSITVSDKSPYLEKKVEGGVYKHEAKPWQNKAGHFENCKKYVEFKK